MVWDAASLTFMGGVLMGLASSLHCATMCGGVASALMFAFSGSGAPHDARRALILSQAGRASGYVIAGGAAASLGAGVMAALDHGGALIMLRWASAAALAWIGLATMGLVPAFNLLHRLVARVARPTGALALSRGGETRTAAPFLSGLAWACAPCPMVLAALLYAGLAGSTVEGMAVMAGFALGTMPSITASAFGMYGLRGLARNSKARIWVGLALVTLAVASVVSSESFSAAICSKFL